MYFLPVRLTKTFEIFLLLCSIKRYTTWYIGQKVHKMAKDWEKNSSQEKIGSQIQKCSKLENGIPKRQVCVLEPEPCCLSDSMAVVTAGGLPGAKPCSGTRVGLICVRRKIRADSAETIPNICFHILKICCGHSAAHTVMMKVMLHHWWTLGTSRWAAMHATTQIHIII